MTSAVTWSTTVGPQIRTGRAGATESAWPVALTATLALAAETASALPPHTPIEVQVGGRTAQVYPEFDVDGHYDPGATAAAVAALQQHLLA